MRLHLLILLLSIFTVLRAEQWCQKDIYPSRIHTTKTEIDVLVMWNPARVGSLTRLELCSSRNGLPFERHCSWRTSQADNGAVWDVVEKGTQFVNCSSIYNNCKSDSFQHYYIHKNKQHTKFTNRWHSAKMGELAITNEPCLLATGLPLAKRCVYNARQYLAEWERSKDVENAKCLLEINENLITFDLYKLYNEAKSAFDTKTAIDVISKVRNLLAKSGTVRTPADLEITTQILFSITQRNPNIELLQKIQDIVNQLLGSPEYIVQAALKLNTPKSLINAMENYHDIIARRMFQEHNCNLVPNGVIHHATNLTSAFYVNPACSKITGIAVYSTLAHPTAAMTYDTNIQGYLRFIQMNESLDDVAAESHLQMAAYIPQTAWEALIKNDIKRNELDVIRILLYKNGNFFIDRRASNGYQVDTPVLSISVPGHKADLSESIPIILQYHKNDDQVIPKCSSFIDGTWISNADAQPLDGNLLLCKTVHLKQLAAVRRVEHPSPQIHRAALLTVISDSTVNVISIVGSGLSLFALVCIWMTALCCTHWRSQTSNQLLLNLCFVLTLIMVYFLFINISSVWDVVVDISNNYHCVAMGAFLQYTILVLLMWMLFIGFFQYQRYNAVVGSIRTSNFVAKYALAAWGLPMVPIALLILFDSKSYVPQGEDPICYPSGIGFYLTVVLPISCLIILNVVILIYIFFKLRKSLTTYRHTIHRQQLRVQIRLSIFLFILLALSWIFGIISHLNDSLLFSFLFCLTSTFQGLMLFVYFVVVDKNDQFAWVRCCVPKDYFPKTDTVMSQLTTFASEY
ncbi:adhesion G-protein coupled receptor G4 [Musca domestica]|uniref:Adhesion G-protein coupled receptor G4 n=1 Tax=Musca domestica TaxID=7370 RepID=A0A1I8NGK6_MUSDO|nr:adhesion G-protein coupled receptor G4 [Musca domestica]